MDWSLPLDAIDLERAVKLHQRFATCCQEMTAKGPCADTVSAAVAAHLTTTTTTELPPAARPIWQERVARPLKADPARPLPERAVAAIRSWPAARAGDLHNALIEIEALIAEAENDAHHEAIYVEISRAYS